MRFLQIIRIVSKSVKCEWQWDARKVLEGVNFRTTSFERFVRFAAGGGFPRPHLPLLPPIFSYSSETSANLVGGANG